MERKEEIVRAALKLASVKGLGRVSMSDIAEEVGIRKASLYSHFRNKEELIDEMYAFLRKKAIDEVSPAPAGYPAGKSEVLPFLADQVSRYGNMNRNKDMMSFYKVIYSEWMHSPAAARIILLETDRMRKAVEAEFYVLKAKGLLCLQDIESEAVSYSYTIHELMMEEIACETAGRKFDRSRYEAYIRSFVERSICK